LLENIKRSKELSPLKKDFSAYAYASRDHENLSKMLDDDKISQKSKR